jgi:hypothetical protein
MLGGLTNGHFSVNKGFIFSDRDDPRLRSTQAINGYHIQTSETVVEGYEALRLSDQKVDSLLSETARRDVLRR